MIDESPSAPASPDEHLDRARDLISRGDIDHAANHLAAALALDPARAEGYELVEAVYARSSAGDALFPVDGDGVFIGDVVAKAHLLARTGDINTALSHLVQATLVEPGKPWLDHGAMADPRVRAALDPVPTALLLTQLGTKLSHPAPAACGPVLDICGRLIDARPDHIDLAVRLSGAARAFGAQALASAWCERAEKLTPGPLGMIMMGYALRDAERFTEMEAVWTRASAADPGNVDVRVDLAATLIRQGRRADGERWLAAAAALAPDDARVRALGHALRYADTGDAAHLIALVDEARSADATDAVTAILDLACDTRTWLNRVPMPSESVTHLAAFIASERAGGKTVAVSRTRVSAIEPASAVAALAIVAPSVRVQVMACPAPDLRIPPADASIRVWAYDGGTTPIAALPAPPAAAADMLRDVAALAWTNPVAAYHQASWFASIGIDDLLGLLCHIPPAPATSRWRFLCRTTPAYWPRLAQPWICLGILHHGRDEPWASSTRRRVLIDLVNGVEDWTVDAALFALIVAAWIEPAARDDVLGIVRDRLDAARATARRRLMTIAPSIAELMLITPGATPDDRRRARRLITECQRPTASVVGRLWWRLRSALPGSRSRG